MLFGIIIAVGVLFSFGAFISDTFIDSALDATGVYDEFGI